MKILRSLAFVVTLLLTLSACPLARNLKEYRLIIESIEIGEVDLLEVEDGIYYGEMDAVIVSAEVWVSVFDHKITKIELKHNHGRGKDAEVIVKDVTEKQTLKIDIITGATSSSKVILKAIEQALKSERLILD